MFVKSIIFVGLLAVFMMQGMDASQQPARSIRTDARTMEQRALSDLIDKFEEIIENLKNIVDGALTNAWDTIIGLVDTIKALKDKFMGEGITAIKQAVTDAIKYIEDKVKEAANAGIDITKCVIGKHEQLGDLIDSMTDTLTKCITDPVSAALEMINNDLKLINEITNSVTSLPAKLTKCLISLRPITCVENLIKDTTALVVSLPGQIEKMVEEALNLVKNITQVLEECVSDIQNTTMSQIKDLIEEFDKCVDEYWPEGSTTVAN